MNWQFLATSHYQTAVAVQNELRQGHTKAAAAGIEELIDALARSETSPKQSTRAVDGHVLKWKEQPEQRSRNWAASIAGA